MAFDPQKFFIGVVDFFAVLMPGALLAYFGKDLAASGLFVTKPFALTDAQGWMVFLFASYLLGHFVFLLGSLLDEYLCDRFMKCTYRGQIGHLAKGKSLSSPFLRWLARTHFFFGKSDDKALMQAERIKGRALQRIGAADAMNAFQWCKAILSKENPTALVAVQRFEADSKFFRSLVVALPILAISFYGSGKFALTIASVIGTLMALWRYIEMRSKATQQAYWFIIALESAKPATATAAPTVNKADGLTHAGGVVYREQNEVIEYLLVEGEKKRSEWLLPKGHIEAGEDPRETAVREVKEETGHWSRNIAWATDSILEGRNEVVRFYCMELASNACQDDKDWPKEKRQHRWCSFDQAMEYLAHTESKEALRIANGLVRKRGP